jgi:tetratricopeptide (TPR) repeat protein
MRELDKILDDWEKEIIYNLSVLPVRFYSIPDLIELFRIEEYEQAAFFDSVHDLSSKGILDIKNATYCIKPTIADSIIHEIQPGIEECSKVVNYYSDKLEIHKLDFEKGFRPIYDQLVVLLDKINKNSLHLAQLCYLLSSNLIRFNKFDEALVYNQMAVEISEKIDNRHPIVALFYRDKAFIHKKLGDANKSIYYSLKDIEILERSAGKYDDLLPDSYFALSKTYEGIHDYQKAVEYNLKAIKYEKKRSRKKSINLSNLYHNLAYYYVKLNNLHHASMFINKAVEAFSKDKQKDKNEYLQLVKDQKKFNSLYEIEIRIKKLKIPILIILALLVSVSLWLIFRLII